MRPAGQRARRMPNRWRGLLRAPRGARGGCWNVSQVTLARQRFAAARHAGTPRRRTSANARAGRYRRVRATTLVSAGCARWRGACTSYPRCMIQCRKTVARALPRCARPSPVGGLLAAVAAASRAPNQPLASITAAALAFVRAEMPPGQKDIVVTAGRLDPRLRFARCRGPLAAALLSGGACRRRPPSRSAAMTAPIGPSTCR